MRNPFYHIFITLLLTIFLILCSPCFGEVRFTSILTNDLKRLVSATSFSKNDKIYLHTVWTGLVNDHEVTVIWIRPDGVIQEATKIKIKIPPNIPKYTTWSWLKFKKGLLDLLSPKNFNGIWSVQLFLDESFLAEYSFSVGIDYSPDIAQPRPESQIPSSNTKSSPPNEGVGENKAKRLEALKALGLISQEEFEKEKARLETDK